MGSGARWSRCLALKGLSRPESGAPSVEGLHLHTAGDPGLYFRCRFKHFAENWCPKLLVELVRSSAFRLGSLLSQYLPCDPSTVGIACFLVLVRLDLTMGLIWLIQGWQMWCTQKPSTCLHGLVWPRGVVMCHENVPQEALGPREEKTRGQTWTQPEAWSQVQLGQPRAADPELHADL